MNDSREGAQSATVSRRRFLFNTLNMTLSGTAVALLAGRPALARAAAGGDTASDIRILDTALAAEREAVAAYQLGADSGLLESAVLDVATRFQGHHEAHADVLASTIRKLGGEPSEPAESHDFPTDRLHAQADVLEFAASLEHEAVRAYAGAIPAFANRDLSKAASGILADEAMHWAVLRNALGIRPVVPGAFIS